MPAPFQPFFVHDPLDTTTESIRLLRLLPGSKHEDIECELFNTCFPILERYHAVSYEWGAPNTELSIKINGITFLTQPNLHAFLYQIRSQLRNELPLVLWIDAICIDQYSINERNHQVQMMKRVFSEAYETLVWLGKCSQDMSAMFKVLNDYCDLYDNIIDLSSWPPLAFPGELETAISIPNAGEAIVHLANQTYWTRIWILQEIALSKRQRILIANGHLRNGALATLYILTLFPHSGRKGTLMTSPMGSALYVWSEIRKFGLDNALEILEGLQEANSQCTILHDRLYGLLGISKDAHKFKVDYSKSLPELILELVSISPVKRVSTTATLRHLLLVLDPVRDEETLDHGHVNARISLFHDIWAAERFDHVRAQNFGVDYESMSRIHDTSLDESTETTTFASAAGTYQVKSTVLFKSGWWHFVLKATDVSFLFSGSISDLELEAVVLATSGWRREDGGLWGEEATELACSAYTHHGRLFDVHSTSRKLLRVGDSRRGAVREASMPLDVLILIAIAELPLSPFQRGDETVNLRQIWPLR